MYSLYFLKRKKKKSTTNSSPPPWEFLLSIHFQFIVSLLLLLLLEVNTWSSFLWFTFSSLLETRFERRFVEKLSGGTISSAGGFLIVPRVRVGERRRWRRGVFPPRFLPPSRDSGGARLKVSTRWERVERFVEKSLRLRAKVRTDIIRSRHRLAFTTCYVIAANDSPVIFQIQVPVTCLDRDRG